MYLSLWFHFTGYILKLEWFCVNSHRDFWYSSPFYGSAFAVNYMDASLLVLGANFNQFQRFCKFVNLGKPCSSLFYRNQRMCAIPTIEQHYIEMRNAIIFETKKQREVVLCRDCQLDSPGWSATKRTYTFLDYNRKKMINVEFGDKREVEHWVIHLWRLQKSRNLLPYSRTSNFGLSHCSVVQGKGIPFSSSLENLFWKFSHKLHQWDQYATIQ